MTYPALAIANEFIRLGIQSKRPVDPMKLQKLVYLAHGWHLAFKGTPLINERIEAWQYGPVVPSLYSQFKRYGAGPINMPRPEPEEALTVSPEVKALIQQVWKKYGGLGAIKLSELTHESGYAWDQTRRRNEEEYNGYVMSNRRIAEEFKSRLLAA